MFFHTSLLTITFRRTQYRVFSPPQTFLVLRSLHLTQSHARGFSVCGPLNISLSLSVYIYALCTIYLHLLTVCYIVFLLTSVTTECIIRLVDKPVQPRISLKYHSKTITTLPNNDKVIVFIKME